MTDNKRINEATERKDAPGTAEARADTRRRRTLLAAISTGGMIASSDFPDRWSRPVIDSVMLPAHAQVSPGGQPGAASSCTVTAGIIGFQIEGETGGLGSVPFTGTIGEIPPSTVAPTGSTGTVRWFVAATDINGNTTASGGFNGCVTISRGSSSYTVPLDFFFIDEDCFI